jgi:uncharacterized protein YceK
MKKIILSIVILFILNGCASTPVTPEPDPNGMQKKNMNTEDNSTLKIYKK